MDAVSKDLDFREEIFMDLPRRPTYYDPQKRYSEERKKSLQKVRVHRLDALCEFTQPWLSLK
ncbi:MAG: hypothetical protein NPINA01_11930 [Nitrospinaceae bacterium]|nr:MAG: hypothetical protein NPINA01_11930 [Nitrospinaceae bacterium]